MHRVNHEKPLTIKSEKLQKPEALPVRSGPNNLATTGLEE